MEFRYRTFLILIILNCATSQFLYNITAMTGYILIGSEVRNISNERIKECNFSENVYRLVIDLHARNYVHGVYMSFNSTANITMVGYDSNLAVDGNYRCTKSGDLALYFRCEHVMKVLVIEGLLNCYSLRLEGYDPHLDQILGCFKKRSMDMYTDCYPVCTTIYIGYTVSKCLCTNSLFGMPTTEFYNCLEHCHYNPYILCGKERQYIAMYVRDSISIYAKVPTHATNLYNLIPQTCKGRSGVNCEIIDCTKSPSLTCYPNMICLNGIVSRIQYILCQCNIGFYRENVYICEDIDECKITPHDQLCMLNVSSCINTLGSYTCICNDLFVPYLDSCIDVTQCSQLLCNNYPCMKGRFYHHCICPSGFNYIKGLPQICSDIDECQFDIYCSNGICENTIGSYVCTCAPGFEIYDYKPDTKDCKDKDECQSEIYCPNGKCENNIGNYICICTSGFMNYEYKPGIEDCRDIDECHNVHYCDLNSTVCLNIIGSYTCECFLGFTEFSTISCSDIDECSTLINNCGENANCSNTIGSFVCSCPNGTIIQEYAYKTECEDINECRTNKFLCDLDTSFCLNTLFSYICQCRHGYAEVNDKCERIAINVTTLFDDDDDYETTTMEEKQVVANFITILTTLLSLTALVFLSLTVYNLYIRNKPFSQESTADSTIRSTTTIRS